MRWSSLVEINRTKSSLNVLQAATIVNPRMCMRLVYEQSPILADLPLVSEGFTCVGTSIGPLLYIQRFMAERFTTLSDEFKKLLCHPFPQDFLQFVRYCCNQKIIHVLRHLGPKILDSAQRLDLIIDQLIDDYYDLRLQAPAPLLGQGPAADPWCCLVMDWERSRLEALFGCEATAAERVVATASR